MSMQNLYRLWNEDDELLYVGISKSAMHRIVDHLRNQPWSSSIAKMTIEQFADRSAVEKAERLAIAKENPIHNKQRYSLSPIPTDELWQILSPNERRMVGHVLNNIANDMNYDETDMLIHNRDDSYQSVSQLINLVGRWFTHDEQPNEVLRHLFILTKNERNKEHLKTARRYERDMDFQDLQEECKELKIEIKDLKQSIRSEMRNKKLQM